MAADVLIIGGGATGGGLAWDLALRGVSVILAEMGDLATGTSGRYHGLLHSGGRYAVRDPESAKECIDENLIVRRIAPEAVEETGGYFVLCPGDDEAYVEQWLAACAASGIETRYVPLAEARRREPALNPATRAVYWVPDGTCDSWDLLHALQKGAEATGRARFLTYHKTESFHLENGRVVGARLLDLRKGEMVDVTCRVVVNAAGPWAAQVAAQAGARFKMKLSRGAMLAYNIRWVNTVINKLRLPGDGDIFVPVGTVSVIGTTSVKTDDPDDTRVEPWEVTRVLDEAEAMTPGISKARILRAWGGVRPLYDPDTPHVSPSQPGVPHDGESAEGEVADGRAVKRTFTMLDHGERGEVEGLISIIGGKLTTYRLMAEQVADRVCAQLGVTAPCTTATTILPRVHAGDAHAGRRTHELKDRLNALEHGETPGALICECELITAPQMKAALSGGEVNTLNDLRRDLRLGMGPCQGGFCAVRAAGLRHEFLHDTPMHSHDLLAEFVERRFGGTKALLWGHNLRQALLAEHLYTRVMGVGVQRPTAHTQPSFAHAGLPKIKRERPLRVVVVGAGLAGLTAALAASQTGAQVELVAQGTGMLPLMPGWIETGDVSLLSAQPNHPYTRAGSALPTGLAVLNEVARLYPVGAPALTLTGAKRHIAYTVGETLPAWEHRPLLIVGIEGWREFYPHLIADHLKAQGHDVDAIYVSLPHMGGNFDDWPLDYANYLDTDEGLRHLAEQIKPRMAGAQVIALPAILGFEWATKTKLADLLGIDVMEIPVLPPSVLGQRLYRALRQAFTERGGRMVTGSRVVALERRGERVAGVYAETAAHNRPRLIAADAVILATGGLYGGGLESNYRGEVVSSVAGVPVRGVPSLMDWFTSPLLAGDSQPMHQIGVMTDHQLRPVNEAGQAIAPNLYAAGRLLAHYSPIVEGSSEGVDIATGVAATMGALELTPNLSMVSTK